MTSAGRTVLPDLLIESFVIDNEILNELQKNEQVWNNFQNFPFIYEFELITSNGRREIEKKSCLENGTVVVDCWNTNPHL